MKELSATAKKKAMSSRKKKCGVPKKYLAGAKNKSAKEREIMDTKERYKKGLPIDIKKVSKSRASQSKTKKKRSRK